MSAQLNNWTDIAVAYHVARLGTLSAAADYLDVHHSTVLRRIEALEKRLNVILFQRSARGYVATEAGSLLMKVAEHTEQELDKLVGQLQGVDQQISGTLVVTSVSSFSEPLIQILSAFQKLHPDLKIEYVEDSRLYRLEHGEAHVSIRPGLQPKDPDYVVQPLASLPEGLYASKNYIKKYGKMKHLEDIDGHRFISTLRSRVNVPTLVWLRKVVPEDQIVFKTVDFIGMRTAIANGAGIGGLSHWMASHETDLVPVVEPPDDWVTKLWLVTHRDVHRTEKIQTFTRYLKEHLTF